jgi:hypothetical protein
MSASWKGGPADHRGVYLQVVGDDQGKPVAYYLGKHEGSVQYRQTEHYDKLKNGTYSLYDRSGERITHLSSGTPDHALALKEYVDRTTIYVGRVHGLNQAMWTQELKAVEGLSCSLPSSTTKVSRSRGSMAELRMRPS